MMETPPSLEQKAEQEALALDIAQDLNDPDNLEHYLELIKKHPKELILRAFRQAKEIPDYKIKKIGDYFIFLLNLCKISITN